MVVHISDIYNYFEWWVVLNERIFKLVSCRLAEHTYQVPSREASQ